MLQDVYCHLVWRVNEKSANDSSEGAVFRTLNHAALADGAPVQFRPTGSKAVRSRSKTLRTQGLDGARRAADTATRKAAKTASELRERVLMSPATNLLRYLAVLLLLTLTACGYSQEEWDQKVRENESLRDQLTAQRQAHKKCGADYAAALQQIDELKRQLTERGINVENLNASLA